MLAASEGEPAHGKRHIRIFGAGTSCVDVSTIGCQLGLLGGSSRPLAIWLSEIKLVKPDIVFHECTGRFTRELFVQYLPEYEMYVIEKPEVPCSVSYQVLLAEDASELPMQSHCGLAGEWLVSQHFFGWPCFRPRLYTVLVLKATGYLRSPALNLVTSLYKTPSTSAADLYCAPQACGHVTCITCLSAG